MNETNRVRAVSLLAVLPTVLPIMIGAAVLATSVACVAPAAPDAARTADQLALIELTHRYAWGIDTNDREMLATVFARDAKAHYVEVGKKVLDLDVRLDGFDAIYEWLDAGVGGRKGADGLPWHFMSNHLIDLDGDTASMTWYMHNRTMAAGGVYYVEAVRTQAGWRIKRLRLEEQTWKPEAYRDRMGDPSLRSGPE